MIFNLPRVFANLTSASLSFLDENFNLIATAIKNAVRGNVYNVDQYADLNSAVAVIGSANATLLISTQTTLSANLTIPENISVEVSYPGKIATAAFALAINGLFIAGNRVTFSGFSAGDITFGPNSVKEIPAEWFGATGDGLDASATTNYTAITSALAAAINVKHVVLGGSGSGKYVVNDPIIINGNTGGQNSYLVEGLSNTERSINGVQILMSGNGDASKNVFEIYGAYNVELKNLAILGNNAGSTDAANRSKTGIYLHRESNILPGVTHTIFNNVQIYFCKTGLRIGSYDFNESNNEDGTFNKLVVSYCDIGIANAWPNNIANNFYESSVHFCDKGLAVGQSTAEGDAVNGQSGDILISSMNWGYNAVDIYLKSDITTLTIFNLRVEGSSQFIGRTAGIGSPDHAFGNLTVTGGIYYPINTGVLIDSPLGSNVFINVSFGAFSSSVPAFNMSYGTSTFIGCSFISDIVSDIFSGASVFRKADFKNCKYWTGSTYALMVDSSITNQSNHTYVNSSTLNFSKFDSIVIFNTGATSVTTITGPHFAGRVIHILMLDTVTTLVHGGGGANVSMHLAGGANISSATVAAVTLMYDGYYGLWWEISRRAR